MKKKINKKKLDTIEISNLKKQIEELNKNLKRKEELAKNEDTLKEKIKKLKPKIDVLKKELNQFANSIDGSISDGDFIDVFFTKKFKIEFEITGYANSSDLEPLMAGDIDNVKIIKSTGDDYLDEVILDCVREIYGTDNIVHFEKEIEKANKKMDTFVNKVKSFSNLHDLDYQNLFK